MPSKKLITVFGATGRQGGSIISTAQAHPNLANKSRDLQSNGVDILQANLNDVSSLQAAVADSNGVFGVTDFWSLLDKDKEIEQGKAIFDASKAAGVGHFVWSSLPYAEKLTGGRLTRIDHFDSKAVVQEYTVANKPEGIVSLAGDVSRARHDGGNYVMRIFEGGEAADGAIVHGVSTWTTPREVIESIGRIPGVEVVFEAISVEEFASSLPEKIAWEIAETMLLAGEYSYYGKGSEKRQAQGDEWLVERDLMDWPTLVKEGGPWSF